MKNNHLTRQIEWLQPIQFPIANKFIRENGFRGQVRSNDQCIVVRNQQAEIIAVACLRPIQQYNLLTALAVAADYQGQGCATQLLTTMRKEFTANTYTFSLRGLEPLYRSHGFKACNEDKLPEQIVVRFMAYKKQGRDIIAMGFRQ